MLAFKVTAICSVLIGQVLTLAIIDQNCIINIENTCPGGYCCVQDDFLLRRYCKIFGQAQAPCSTKPSDFECPCAQGLQCASDLEGHITSLFGRCYVILANTTAAPSTSSSTTTATSPTKPTMTTPTSTTQSWTPTKTTVSTTPYLTSTNTELQTTSVSTIPPVFTNILRTTLRIRTKTVMTETVSASTGSEVVTQNATVISNGYDSTSDPRNLIDPIG